MAQQRPATGTVTLGAAFQAGNLVRLTAVAVLFVATYVPVLLGLHEKYGEPDSYYSHGYLIPVISAWIVWRQRETLKRQTLTAWRPGLGVLIAGVLLYLFGRWWFVNFIAAVSIVVVLAGLSLYLFGKAATRALAFPLGFLLFMIPVPKLAIIYITFWLKLFAATVASELVSILGIPVLLEGAFIQVPGGRLEVDNACSGLRSLIALTAMGTLFAYLIPMSRTRTAVVAIAAVPIAVVANILRIVVLVLVTYAYGLTGRAFEVTDFTTGYLIYLVAFGALYLTSQALRTREPPA